MKAGKIGLSLLCTRVRRILCAAAVLLLACAAPTGHAAVEYVYDDLGRLTGVIDDTGAAAHYSYDALGNILSIETTAAGGVSILGFTPNSGAPGDTVTLRGTGFSATQSQNVVTFNGVAATVSTASSTSLVVTVPAFATTGKIGVTTPVGSATSVADFVVAAAGSAPTIANFTPTVGSVGTVVTVTGTNFDPSLAGTTVLFNEFHGNNLVVSSPTSLTVSAPPNTGSGKIRVKTSAGTAISATDFIIAPSGFNPADVVASARIVADGASQALNINTSGKYGVLTFDGIAGAYLSLDVTSFATTPSASLVNYWVFSPKNVQLATGSFTARGSIHIPALPSTGGYSIYFRPVTATASLAFSLVKNKSITADGAQLNNTIAFTGQSIRFSWNGALAQNLGLGISALTLTPSSSSLILGLYKPDGTLLFGTGFACSVSTAGCNVNIAGLPVSGNYTVVATPPSGATGSFTATLSNDVTGTLTPGTPVNLSLSRVGQNGRLSFSGTAGDNFGLTLSSAVITGSTSAGIASVLKPDGTVLTSTSFSNGQTVLDVPVLPVTGTYSVFIDPPDAATASLGVMLTADVPVPLALDGTPSSVTIPLTGQTARLSFAATAGQNLGFGINGLTLSPSGSTFAVLSLFRPDGARVGSNMVCNVSSGGCTLNFANLPVAGTYNLVVTPQNGGTGSFTATLSSDVSGTLTSGTPLSLSLSRIGQNARLSFSGSTGNSVAVKVFGMTTTPTGQSPWVSVLKPDGSSLMSLQVIGSGGVLNFGSLPATGTYPVLVDPTHVGTTTMQVMLDPGTPLAVDGASANMTLTTTGESARLTFAGTAGQNLGFGISNLTLTPSASTFVQFWVYRPDGAQIASGSGAISTGGGVVNLTNLPATGTYSVVITPQSGTTGSTFTATLSSDVSGTLASGTLLSLNLNRIGQNARLTFSGTAGSSVAVKAFGLVTTPANQAPSMIVLKPDGSSLNSVQVTGPGAILNFGSLPATGTYTVFVDPTHVGTTNMQVMLDPGTPLAVDGASANMSLTTAGESARLTFAGTAGQNLGFGISSLTLTPSASTFVVFGVYRPDGAQIASGSGTLSTGGGVVNLTNLPATGTYSVVVTPQSGTTGSTFTATLSSEISGTLASGTPLSLNLNRIGQNARLTFSGTAGSSVAVKAFGLVTTPANQAPSVSVFKPDGSTLSSLQVNGAGAVLNFGSLPVTGTYTVFVDPTHVGTTNMQVMLDPGAPLAVDGASTNMTLTTVGESARLTFAGTAGQNLGLGISGLTLSPSGSTFATVFVYRPDGTQIVSGSGTVSVGGGAMNIANLPTTGTYSVVVIPQSGGTGSFTMTLSSDVTGSLAAGMPFSLSIGRIGQNARLSFSGTAGQSKTISITSIAPTPAGKSVFFNVYKPDGTFYTSASTSGSSTTINLFTYPVTGTYTLLIEPADIATANMTVTLSP